MGVVSEDPVDPSWIESKTAQPPLQLSDIVTLQHGAATIKESITETKASLDKTRPSLAVANTLPAKAPLGLEHLHSRHRPRAVGTELVVSTFEPEPLEPLLQVNHGFARVALMKWQEVFARGCRPRTAHKPDLCSTSVIPDIVGDAGRTL
jgi:hypothetical protein